MGCSRFFEFHDPRNERSVQEYIEKFGYDRDSLIEDLSQSSYFKEIKEVNRNAKVEDVFEGSITDFDRRTSTLYDQQKTQIKTPYNQRNLSSYFLRILQNIQIETFDEVYSRERNPENYNSYDLYRHEDPYRIILKIIGLVNNGYNIPKIIEEIEDEIPDKEIVSRIIELVSLLKILKNRGICPICGNEINLNENNEFNSCEFCGISLDEDFLNVIELEPRKEFLELSNEIQLLRL